MEEFFFELSIILTGSAVLAGVAVVLKQPVILAYILCGVLAGPWGFGLVHNVHFMEVISHLGITLLLFLAGLTLHPQKLIKVFKNAAIVTASNSLISFIVGFTVTYVFKYSLYDSLVIGFAVMFSSTILVVKLLPTTALHHRRMGAICIGILILQDLIAIAVLAFIRCLNEPDGAVWSFVVLSAKLILFVAALIFIEYYILRRVMAKVDQLHEALFIIGLAWCFGVASFSHNMGLFHETGAFFAGVVLARHKISRFISEELKPLRDFFLVLFFFTLGARIDISLIQNLFLIAVILAVFFVYIRPWIYKRLFLLVGENAAFAEETGVRLGQMSEFALLIGILALEQGVITDGAAQLIQILTILTFIASSYIVFSRYATPIGIGGQAMKD